MPKTETKKKIYRKKKLKVQVYSEIPFHYWGRLIRSII